MRKKFFILLFLAVLWYPLSAQDKDQVQWLTWEQLSDSLTVHPKPVLLFFHTDWCAYCRKMQNVVFTDSAVIRKLDADYYALRFDAESVDTVCFDHQILTNAVSKKRTGHYHQITKLLAAREGKFTFPTTIVLRKDFTVRSRHFHYLDRRKLLKALQ
ncbi:thioredoxin family protein [Sphingobacterium suaedae]|uniref:Thioredoxin family protein n=1 Tax=Sphingobacterium suaedae TaxID=1686402 RepID=A0ABW5KI67_9SPHI